MGKTYHAAFAQIDITPEFPTILVGRYRPDPVNEVLHPLYAQALLFQAKDEAFCLVAIDHLGLNVPLSNIIRTKIAAILSVQTDHVMLNFSHTHSAPDVMPFALNGERYFAFLCAQIEKCVKTAMNGFCPCKIGWALTTVCIAENRRYGGTVIDHRLGAMMVADARNGKPMVLLTRIAAHANILPTATAMISGDFFGVVRQELEQELGVPAMVLQGAAGNLKVAGTGRFGEGDDDILYHIAQEVVRGARNLRFMLEDVTEIAMISSDITCISDVPTVKESEKLVGDHHNPQTNDWLAACAGLREQGIKTQAFQVEMSFLKLNQGCICGAPEEVFCELALDVQERTNNPLVFFNGYTNGCTGYLPSRDEWCKGGYEVQQSFFTYHQYSGRVMPYRAETADRFVDAVAHQWAQMLQC